MSQKSYSELVTQAEQAVSAVKDAELRRVAFEKVLDDLLLRASGESRSPASSSSSRSAATPAPERKKSPSPKATQSGPKAYIEEMIEDGFFAKPKSIAEVKAELENRGHHIPVTSLSGPLQRLCQQKALRRQKADGTFGYSKW